jgi:DNA helicase-2/ATP-dependent DNA helicase PcrA
VIENFEKEYARLNPDQKKAVDTIEGPVLVIAGPGTGKTQVLSLRIANILKQTDVDPKSILCLTFQDASVFAMKQRLQKFIGQAAYKVQIHTFHSFCSDVIRTFPHLFDFSERVEPIKDVDKLEIFREILVGENLQSLQQRGDILGNFKGIVSAISDLKKEFINPEKFLFVIENFRSSLTEKELKLETRRIDKLIDLQKFYKKYLEVMEEKSLIDFDDMIFKVTEKFSSNDDLVRYYQEQFLYTLVDEFQDTNSAQLQVIKSISSFESLEANVFAVGDDDQTIFRFQGASSTNFDKFLEIFPQSEIIVLHTNYRSVQPVIDAATNLIENNPNRLSNSTFFTERGINKNFISALDSSDPNVNQIHTFEHSFHEDFWIGEKINEFAEQGVPLNEVAIIARTNKQITNITKFLDRFGIPYQIKKSESLLDDRYIKDMLFIIDLISDPKNLKNNEYLWRLLTLDFFGINNFDAFNLFHLAKTEKLSIFDYVIKNDKPEYQAIRELFHRLLALEYFAENNSFLLTYTKMIHAFDLIKFFESQNDAYATLNKISSLYQFIQSRGKFLKKYFIKDFLREVNLMSEKNINLPIDKVDPNSEDKINILTAHSAKGLEFKKVFIYQTVENKWEKMRGPSDGINLPPLGETVPDKELEKIADEIDERRLFYVSVTRAKENLFITYSKKYYDSDSGEVDLNEKLPSRFLGELQIENTTDHPELVQKHTEISKIILSEEAPVIVPDNNKQDLLNLIENKLTLSASRINKYQKCHYKFLLEDLYKVPLPESPSLLLGTLVHEGIEKIINNYELIINRQERESVESDSIFSGEESTDSMIDRIIAEQIEKLNQALDEIEVEKEQLSPDVLRSDLEKSLRVYFDYYKNNPVKRARAEFWTTGTIDGIKINGRIDMISGEDFGYVITDFKTSSNVPSITEFLGFTKNADKNHLRQLLFYKLLLQNSDNAASRLYADKIRFLRIEYIDIKEGQIKSYEIPVSGDFEYKPRSNSKNTETFDIDNEIELLRKELGETYKSIEALDFVRTENRKICQTCPLKEHCGR